MLAAFGTEPGLDRDVAIKAASSFGGGIARTGQMCGAVTGALTVIGLKYGTADPKDRLQKNRAYGLVREFMEKFRSLNGSLLCRELLGHDIGTKEGYRIVKDKKLISTLCPKFVKGASEILEEIL